jgi:hypothetical protein
MVLALRAYFFLPPEHGAGAGDAQRGAAGEPAPGEPAPAAPAPGAQPPAEPQGGTAPTQR